MTNDACTAGSAPSHRSFSASVVEFDRRAAEKSLANYAFYLGGTNDNLDVIRALDPRAAAGVKVKP